MRGPGSAVSPDQYLRRDQRRPRQNKQEPGGKKARNALQVVQVNATRSINVLVDLQLSFPAFAVADATSDPLIHKDSDLLDILADVFDSAVRNQE